MCDSEKANIIEKQDAQELLSMISKLLILGPLLKNDKIKIVFIEYLLWIHLQKLKRISYKTK